MIVPVITQLSSFMNIKIKLYNILKDVIVYKLYFNKTEKK